MPGTLAAGYIACRSSRPIATFPRRCGPAPRCGPAGTRPACRCGTARARPAHVHRTLQRQQQLRACVPRFARRISPERSTCAGRKASAPAPRRVRVSCFDFFSSRSLPLLMPTFFSSSALRRRRSASRVPFASFASCAARRRQASRARCCKDARRARDTAWTQEQRPLRAGIEEAAGRGWRSPSARPASSAIQRSSIWIFARSR